jgi:hypothetical protein
MNQVTFNNVETGYFQVFVNNELQKGLFIYNACAGWPGRGKNVYGICWPNDNGGKRQIVGSLQKAKKTLETLLNK